MWQRVEQSIRPNIAHGIAGCRHSSCNAVQVSSDAPVICHTGLERCCAILVHECNKGQDRLSSLPWATCCSSRALRKLARHASSCQVGAQPLWYVLHMLSWAVLVQCTMTCIHRRVPRCQVDLAACLDVTLAWLLIGYLLQQCIFRQHILQEQFICLQRWRQCLTSFRESAGVDPHSFQLSAKAFQPRPASRSRC